MYIFAKSLVSLDPVSLLFYISHSIVSSSNHDLLIWFWIIYFLILIVNLSVCVYSHSVSQ